MKTKESQREINYVCIIEPKKIWINFKNKKRKNKEAASISFYSKLKRKINFFYSLKKNN